MSCQQHEFPITPPDTPTEQDSCTSATHHPWTAVGTDKVLHVVPALPQRNDTIPTPVVKSNHVSPPLFQLTDGHKGPFRKRAKSPGLGLDLVENYHSKQKIRDLHIDCQRIDRNRMPGLKTAESSAGTKVMTLTPPLCPVIVSPASGTATQSSNAPGGPRESCMFPRFGYPIPQDLCRKPHVASVWQDEKAQSGEHCAVRSRGTSSPRSVRKRPETRLGSDIQAEYVGPNLGDPCSLQSLDHLLACGHKILTLQPEACAMNCHATGRQNQVREIDSHLACFECIGNHLLERRRQQVADFRAELETSSDKAYSSFDIDRKVKLMERGWDDQDMDEIRRLTAGRRISKVFWLEPHFQEMVNAALFTNSGQLRRVDSSATDKTSFDGASWQSSTVCGGSAVASSRSSAYSVDIAADSDKRESKIPHFRRSVLSLFKSHERQENIAAKSSHDEDDDAWSVADSLMRSS